MIGQGRTAAALHVYELFKLVAQRTRLARRFADVIDSHDNWMAVEAGLMLSLNGQRAAPPPLEGGGDAAADEWEAPETLTCSWWAGRRAFSLLLAVCSPCVFQARTFLAGGRNKLYVSVAALWLLILSFAYWRWGPAIVPGCAITVKPDDAPDDGARSEVSEPSGNPGVPSSPAVGVNPADSSSQTAITKLAEEMQQLRTMMASMSPKASGAAADHAALNAQASASPPTDEVQSAQLAALLNFASNQPPQGPISATGAAHWGAQGFLPTDPAQNLGPALSAAAPTFFPGQQGAQNGAASMGYNPFLEGAMLAKQIEGVVSALGTWEAQKSVNGLWVVHFWQEVTRLDATLPFGHELRQVLLAHGYSGPGSARRSALWASWSSDHAEGQVGAAARNRS